ncbi:MAG TPA: VOC family protein [Streptosporangiaceae bacterium]|nr:VOC family protein [Streptosporangiaceae bacterium]
MIFSEGYERSNLAKDASLPLGPASSSEFSLGIPARSSEEVDQLLRLVQAAGGTLTAPAHMRPFGVYSGYFTDPDGHLFEIAWDAPRPVRGTRRSGHRHLGHDDNRRR